MNWDPSLLCDKNTDTAQNINLVALKRKLVEISIIINMIIMNLIIVTILQQFNTCWQVQFLGC